MDETTKSAVTIYGQYLDDPAAKMDKTVIDAIRVIREYAYLRDPSNEHIHRTIITAKRNSLSGAELQALVCSPDWEP